AATVRDFFRLRRVQRSGTGNVSRVTLYFRTVFVEAIAAEVSKHSGGTLRIINPGRRTIMSVRSTVIQLAAKTGMLIAALFVVTVLLAAIPQHKEQRGQPLVALNGDVQPGLPDTDSQKIVVRASDAPAQESQQEPVSTLAATADEKANEQAAVHDMT